MLTSTFAIVAGLSAAAQAFTQPKGDPTWGPVRSPNLNSQVVRGEKFNITWDPETRPTQDVTVSIVLCKGPGSNCQLQSNAIAEKLPAAQKSFEWYVPCELSPGIAKTATGYGLAVIVDQTGEYQYSTQFSIQEGDACQVAPTNGSSSVKMSTFETVPLPTNTGPQSFTSVTATATSEANVSSSTTVVRTSTTAASTTSSRTTAVAASSTTAASTTNGAASMATNAAGAMLAVGVALLAM